MPWFQTPPRFADAPDWTACREIIKTGSKSFYAASLVLPVWLRNDAYALYAFCRMSDDAVDVEAADLDTVERLRRKLDRAYAGAPADHPVERAFTDMIVRHRMPRALPEALIDGVAWDVDGVVCETLSDVYSYSAGVAASVGAMMAVLMGVRSRDLMARACDLGVAMQLTNIARDVGEDARNGRLYLPRDWMREEGLDPDAWLANPAFNDSVARVVDRLLRTAEGLYQRADPGIAALPRSCRPGIFAAKYIYREIGTQIAASGFDSIRQRATTGRLRKALLLGRAAVASFLKPSVATGHEPLPETQYLIEAAPTDSWAGLGVSRRGVERLTDKIVWTAALFADLNQRQVPARADG